MGRGRGASSSNSISSLESINYPSLARNGNHNITDLRLGLSISSPYQPDHLHNPSSTTTSTASEEPCDNGSTRRPQTMGKATIMEEGEEGECNSATLFVKVYMEGIPIGRKLNLLAHDGYHDLIATLDNMFNTTIFWAEIDGNQYEQYHVLTYEDGEGDWLIVGDVPWEMFLSSVRRLKITKVDP